MADDIQLKRSNVPGLVPAAAELLDGELAINTADAILYAKAVGGAVVALNPAPAVTDIKSGSASVQVSESGGVYTIDVTVPEDSPSDWSETDPSKAQFIKNKPTALSQFSNDKGYVDAAGASAAAPVQAIFGANAAVVTSIGGGVTVDVPAHQQSDWAESDVLSPAFILNKPTKLSQFTNDKGFVDAGGASAAAPVQSITSPDGSIAVAGSGGEITLSVVAIASKDQADWGVSDTESPSYILNKPTKLSEFANDSSFINAAAAASAAPVQGIASGTNVTVTAIDGVYTISALSNPGTVTKVSGVAPITVTSSTSTPEVSVASATTESTGVVRLASQLDVADGVAGRVVDAAQLLSSIPTKLSQLANDQGFITQSSVDTAVAKYLPLSGGTVSGPVLVSPGGSIRGPTPPLGDASLLLATTEWVQRELEAIGSASSSWVFGGADTAGDPTTGYFRLSSDGLFLAISKYDVNGDVSLGLALRPGDEIVMASAPPAFQAPVWLQGEGDFAFSWYD